MHDKCKYKNCVRMVANAEEQKRDALGAKTRCDAPESRQRKYGDNMLHDERPIC